MQSYLDNQPLRPAMDAAAREAAGIGDLVLRLVGGENHGRVIRIHAAKCTVGSAPGCTLRLKAPGVEPIHALIMRGPQGAIIRRYGEKLEINEADVDDASLRTGDRLQIGPIKLTVLGANATEDDVRVVTSPSALKLQKVLQEKLRKVRRQGHDRLKRLLKTLRQQRQQVRDLTHNADRRKVELERMAQQLGTLQRELTTERERQLSADQDQRTALLQVDQLTHSLERLRQDFLATQTRHRQESDHWRLDQSRLTEEITERDRRLHLLQGELAQRQWDLDQQQSQLKRAQRQFDLEREQHEATRQRLQRETELRQEECASLREEVQQHELKELQSRQDLLQQQRECEMLRQQLERVQRELTQERALLASEQRALQTDGTHWEQQRQELRGEISLRQATIEELETKLQQQESLAGSCRRELEQCQQTLAQFRAQTEAARSSWEEERLQIIAQVSAAAAEDASLVGSKQALIEGLQAELLEASRQLLVRQEEITHHLAEVSQLKSESQANQDAWQQERSRLLQLVDERDRQLETAQEWQFQLDAKSVALQAEQEERQRLERELTRQTEEFNRQCEEAERLRLREADLQGELAADRAELANAIQSRQELQAELARTRSELESLSQPTSTLVMPLISEPSVEELNSRQEIARRESELQQRELELARQGEEVERCRAAQEQQGRELEQGKELLASQIQANIEREQNFQTLAMELHSRAEQIQNSQAELQQLTRELEQLQQQLAAERAELASAREQFATDQQRIVEQTAAEPVTADEAIVEAAQPELNNNSNFTSSADEAEARELAGKSPTSSWGRSELESTFREAQAELERIREEFDSPSIAPADQVPAEADVDEFMALEAEQGANEDEISSTLVINSLRPHSPEEFPRNEESNAPHAASEPELLAPEFATDLEVPQPAAMAADESSTAATVVESTKLDGEENFLMPAWNDETTTAPESSSPGNVVAEQSPAEIEVMTPVVAEPIFAEAIEESVIASESPFPEFSADDLASALGLPTMPAKPADPNLPPPLPEGVSSQFPTDYAVSPDKLPAWSYEHERPARVDTITGLRMQNLLHDTGEFSADRQSPSLTGLPLSADAHQETNDDVAHDEQKQSDSDADIFARLRAAGIVKDLNTDSSVESSPAEVAPPVSAPLSSIDSDEALANALLGDNPRPTNSALSAPSGLVTSALLPADNSDSENEPALKPFNRPGSEAAMTSDAAEDDESIESYMQQLLSRVRGDNSPTGTTGPNPIYKAAAAPHAADEKKPAEAAKPLSITPVTKEEYIPRTAAPEQSMSLAAMREVANSQARSAIQTHASKVGKKQSSGRFLAAAVSFAMAGAGVWWGLETHSRPAIAGGTIGIIVGSYWLIQGIWLARGTIVKGLMLEQPGASKSNDNES